MPEPAILVSIPEPLRSSILTEATRAELAGLGRVLDNEDGRNWSALELAERLPGVDILLASWGLPPLDEAVLARADRLRLVTYAAGSVKGWATDALFDRGIAVSHAAHRIADSVAEFSLMAAMMGLRQAAELDRQIRRGDAWPRETPQPTHEIRDCPVGLLGMGYVGQRAAALFRAVGADVWAYDPYLPPERAKALGVRWAPLDELLATCRVISIHLPVTEETHHLLGARELALIQDGAVLINTARAWVVDQDALLAELRRGRFWAALDVFDPEPLPPDHPLRSLGNVLLTPHVAGRTVESYAGLTATMIAEIARFLRGEPLRHQVTQSMLATMA
jgi:phosphoglycerate dehydrogenase-like enzyme